MAKVTIDPATGALVTGGRKLFPIALSNAPPADRARPGGGNGLAAVAAAGVSIVRTGIADWNTEFSDRADRAGAREARRGRHARPPLLGLAR